MAFTTVVERWQQASEEQAIGSKRKRGSDEQVTGSKLVVFSWPR
jgi:hypothetical protein